MIDPVGVSEIANMLGVTRQQVSQYKFHGKLPDLSQLLEFQTVEKNCHSHFL